MSDPIVKKVRKPRAKKVVIAEPSAICGTVLPACEAVSPVCAKPACDSCGKNLPKKKKAVGPPSEKQIAARTAFTKRVAQAQVIAAESGGKIKFHDAMKQVK